MALAAGGAALVMATAGRVPIAAQSLALGQRHRRTEALFVLTPPPGAWCLACHGTLWWTERHEPKGWRCGKCHPPDHLRAEAVRWEGEGAAPEAGPLFG